MKGEEEGRRGEPSGNSASLLLAKGGRPGKRAGQEEPQTVAQLQESLGQAAGKCWPQCERCGEPEAGVAGGCQLAAPLAAGSHSKGGSHSALS